jgi:hypothetical protein
MKKIFNILCLVIISSILFSCKKFLDTKPQDFLSSSNYFQTEEHLMRSLTGVYDILGSNPIYGANYHSKLGMEAEEGYYFRANLVVGPQVYNITANNTEVLSFWTNLYKGIGRANFLLANVDNNKGISEAFRLQIKGEALFLRGYYYFLLVQNFGGVPLMIKATENANDVHIAKSTAREVYDQVIKDMELAETLVAPIQQLGYGGRVSKSAVRGILARVCLYMAGEPLKDVSKYEKASFWAKKVMDDVEAAHALNTDFNDVFIKYASDQYDIKESIWEVEFWGNATNVYREGGFLGSWHGINCVNTTIGYSQGIMKGTRRLFEKYKSGDLRRDWSLAPFIYRADGTKSLFTVTPTNLQKYDRFSGKYRREYETLLPKDNNNTPINHPLLRYADVLLMFAEAESQAKGVPTPEAIEAVNKVRRRGYGKYLNGIGAVSESISSIIVSSQGTGYTAATTVNIAGGNGTATATAVVSGGKITAVNITNGGNKFSTPPIITFSGAGTGAVATATLTNNTSADLIPADYVSQQKFMENIQDERARELCFEALRKQDLIRWGIFITTMKSVLADMLVDSPTGFMSLAFKNVTEKNLLFPIPANEIGINRGLIQNPDWL